MIFLTLLLHSYRPPLVEGNKSPQGYSLYSQLIHPGTEKEEFHEYITFRDRPLHPPPLHDRSPPRKSFSQLDHTGLRAMVSLRLLLPINIV